MFVLVMDYRQVFATNLRRFRHAKRLSQETLAYETGVNRTYLSKLEKGVTFVGLEVIVKLAEGLDIAPDDLLVPSKERSGKTRSIVRKRQVRPRSNH